MTIDEAIKHAREVAKKNRNFDVTQEIAMASSAFKNKCLQCAEEHEQIAEWLEELKELRVSAEKILSDYDYKRGYSKAINDYTEKIQWEYLNSCGLKQKEIEFLVNISNEVAEQLKEGVEE